MLKYFLFNFFFTLWLHKLKKEIVMQKVKNCKVSVIFGSQNAKKYDIKDYLDEVLDVPPKVLASLKRL